MTAEPDLKSKTGYASAYISHGGRLHVSRKQRDILDHIATWAAKYPCVEAMHIYGSIARGEEKPTSDIDIAFKYFANFEAEHMVTGYTKANDDWDDLSKSLLDRFGHLGRATGLCHQPYDYIAWAAIHKGWHIGRRSKVTLTWTARKRADQACQTGATDCAAA